MKNKYIRQSDVRIEIPVIKISLPDKNFKILVVSENNLVNELEGQLKLGFELVEILQKINPDASSDFNGYKILFRSIKK